MPRSKRLQLKNISTNRHITGEHLTHDVGILFNPRDEESLFDPTSPEDISYAKDIADALSKHYPGHPWLVNVDHTQNMITIQNPMLSQQWGYVKHISNTMRADIPKWTKKVGGEFLERFGVDRGRYEAGSYDHLNAVNASHRDPNRPPEIP